jgi:hypothetical protein
MPVKRSRIQISPLSGGSIYDNQLHKNSYLLLMMYVLALLLVLFLQISVMLKN